jgi:hypothetical protein
METRTARGSRDAGLRGYKTRHNLDSPLWENKKQGPAEAVRPGRAG